MSSDDDYRKQAAAAQEMADRSISDVDKAAWLKVVQSWLRLIRKKPLSTQQTEFDAQKKAHGTGQDNSESSH